MTDHAAHVVDTASADNAASAQTRGFAPAAANGRDTARPAPNRGPHAAETRRLYAADWATFAAWCRATGLAALPASPATVAAHLGSLSATLKPGALARRAAAIADRHRRAGHPPPGTDPAVRAVLRAARSARDRACAARSDAPDAPSPTAPKRRPAPLGPAQLARMAARCPGDLSGLRDRALLLLAAAGLDAERLLGLDHEHVRFTAQGAVLAGLGASSGAGEGVAIARQAAAACPVRALQDWLNRSDTRFGPVFRKVNRWGNVEHRRLRTDALRRIWRRRAVASRPRRPDRAVTSRPPPSTRQASRKAADAADRLLDWLKLQGGLPHESGEDWAEPGQSDVSGAKAPSSDPPMQTDWLHHRLLVAGPFGVLADFQAAARGAGTVPWRLDLDRMEEDLFLLLAAPPSPQRRRLSLAGARTLAGQLRIAAEQRRVAAVARVGQSCACPLDLHALVPVPLDVLCLGPDHPEALAWLWTHWGTTAALRHVAAGPVLPRRAAPGDPVTLDLTFWSADWTPWRAVAAVAARWPTLRFDVRPTYGLL